MKNIVLWVLFTIIVSSYHWFLLVNFRQPLPDRAEFLKACGYIHDAENRVWNRIGEPDYSLLNQ
jgi:hypothetical protein